MFKDLASVDPVLARELWRYLITGGLMFGLMCLLIYKIGAVKMMERIWTSLILGRGARHDQLRRR